MAAGEIAELLGEGAAGRLAVRGTKAGALLARDLAPSAEVGFDYLPVSLPERELEGALRTRMFVAKGAAKSPELFYGPFLQLGTYLDVGPDWLKFVADVALDPINLVVPGLGGAAAKAGVGLTKAGRAARLASALVQHAEVATGAEVVSSASRALHAAARVAGPDGRKLIEAARLGKREFGKIAKGVLASGRLAPEFEPAIRAMAKDGKALASLIDDMHAWKNAGTLTREAVPGARAPGQALLGRTRKDIVALGQANPFLRIAKPDLKNPVNLTKQLFGLGYRGEEFWIPFSSMEFGAAVQGGRGLRKAGAVAFERDPVPGQINNGDVRFMLQHAMVALGVPLDNPELLHSTTGLVTDAMVSRVMKQARVPRAKRAEARERITKKLLDEGYKFMRASDAEVAARQSMVLDEIVASGRPFGPPTPQEFEKESQLRRFAETFNMDGLKVTMDASNPHLALASRVSAVNELSSRITGSVREILTKSYGSVRRAEEVDKVLRTLRENPELWETRVVKGEPRAFLRAADVDRKALFASRLAESEGGWLERTLVEQGLPQHVVELADDIGNAVDAMGASQLSDMLSMETFLTHYWHKQVTSITKKGEKVFRTARTEQMHFFVEDMLQGRADDTLAGVSRELLAAVKQVRSLAKQSKVSPLQARELSDHVAWWLEKEGLIVYEKSSIATVAHWMEAMGRASAANIFVRDGQEVFGPLVHATLRPDLAKLIQPSDTKDLRNAYTRGNKPPAKMVNEGIYKKLSLVGDSRVPLESAAPDFYRTVALEEVGREPQRQIRRLEDFSAKARASVREKVVREIAGTDAIPTGTKGDLLPLVVTRKKQDPVRQALTEDEIRNVLNNREGLSQRRRHKTEIRRWLQSKERDELESLRKVHAEARDELVRRAGEAGESVEKMAKRMAEAVEAKQAERGLHSDVWVRADYAERFEAMFRTWRAGNIENKQWLRKYDEINYGLKSIKLGMDIFHYNVLGIAQFVGTGPVDFLRLLVDPEGRVIPGTLEGAFGTPASRAAVASPEFAATRKSAFVKAGAGAVGGAAAGGAMGDDAGDVGTFSLVGALYGAMLGAAKLNAVWANRMMLNPQNADTLRWMALGLWSGRPDDRAIGGAERMMRNLAGELRKKGGPELLISPLTGAAHVAEAFSRELWETLHNGSKHFYFATRWGHLEPALRASGRFGAAAPGEQNRMLLDLAKDLVQTSNNSFGGQNWEVLLEHPRMQYALRRVLLAPDWTFSRLQMLGNTMLNMDVKRQAVVGAVAGQAVEMAEYGFDPEEVPWRGATFGALLAPVLGRWSQRVARRMGSKGDVMAKEAWRIMATALVGGYAFANALNYAFTGHYMWDNEEGKQLQIEMPGETTLGSKRYVALGKPYLEAFEFMGISDKRQYATPIAGRLRSKVSVPVGAAMTIVDNQGFFGPVFAADDSPLDFAGKVTEIAVDTFQPIFLSGPSRLAQRAFSERGVNAGDVVETGIRLGGVAVTRGQRGVAPADMSRALDLGLLPQAPDPLRGFAETNPVLAGRL
jgi:hypothetical protein